jgi:hypothetical protein
MRRYTQIVFGLNAVIQTVLGFFYLLTPATMIALHGGNDAEQASQLLQVTFRMLGVYLVPVGVMSALVAGRPDDTPIFRALMGLVAVLCLVCWGIIIGTQEVSAQLIAPVAMSIFAQGAILVAVVFYYPRKNVQQFITRKRIAA